MDLFQENLKNWIIEYLKNRHLAFKNLEDISDKDDHLIVKFKDKTSKVFCTHSIEKVYVAINNASSEHLIIVCYNTTENRDYLVKMWQIFTAMKFLTFYFVNPFSKLEKKWIIHPYTHSKVIEKGSIKQGIQSMFETVDIVSLVEIEKILKH